MDANAYRQFSIEQDRGEIALFKRLELNSTGALLDIGCGDGRITAQMADALPEWTVTGLDPNHEMLALANESFDRPNLRFIHSTLDQLPPDATFDTITLLNSLKFIPHADAFLADVHRRLNPNGQLLIFAHPLDSPAAQIVQQILLQPEWEGNIDRTVVTARHYLSEYLEILHELGFETIYSNVNNSLRNAETREKLIERTSMLLPLFGTFNPAEQRRCAEAICDQMGKTSFELIRLAYIGRT